MTDAIDIPRDLEYQATDAGYGDAAKYLLKVLPLVQKLSQWTALTEVRWVGFNRYYVPTRTLRQLTSCRDL